MNTRPVDIKPFRELGNPAFAIDTPRDHKLLAPLDDPSEQAKKIFDFIYSFGGVFIYLYNFFVFFFCFIILVSLPQSLTNVDDTININNSIIA